MAFPDARDWNWHNTIGVWRLALLLIIVPTAVVMSYPWANELVYQMTGGEPPPPGAGPGRGAAPAKAFLDGVDPAWRRAEAQVP